MKIVTGFLCLFFITCSAAVWAEENDDLASESDNAETQTESQPAEPELVVQEQKYVTDKLRLSLYKRPNSNSGTLKLLASGDILDVFERSGPYSKVRTSAGLIGWVKNGFLVTEPTASFQLIEEIKKNEILAQQLEKYADTTQLVSDYENTIEQLNTDQATLQTQFDETLQELEKANQLNTSLNSQIEASQQGTLTLADVIFLAKSYWYFIAAGFLLLVLIGFTLGRVIVESQVRRRFQGVKVW